LAARWLLAHAGERAAYTLPQERAARIDDEGLRRSFLENVQANRDLIHEFENTGSGD